HEGADTAVGGEAARGSSGGLERARREHVLLVFDLVAGGHVASQRERTLAERLATFAERVVAPLRRGGHEAAMPFALLGKPLWPLRGLAALLAHVHVVPEGGGWEASRRLFSAGGDAFRGSSGGEAPRSALAATLPQAVAAAARDAAAYEAANQPGAHVFFMDERRCHECDGLVLTPNERGVRPFTCAREEARPGMYKWKFAARQSLDLLVRHAPTRLCCATDSGESDLVRELDDEAREALASLRDGTIVECRYDGARGRWRIGGAR